MRSVRLLLTLGVPFGTLLGGSPAQAAPATSSAEAVVAPDEEDGGGYVAYWDWKYAQLMRKPLWGITAQLPAGLLKIVYEYSNARGDTFYDRDGNEVQMLPLIRFSNFPNRGDNLVIDPRMKGYGGEHKFHIGYGITDPLDLFLEVPFTTAHTELDLRTYINGRPMSAVEFAVLQGFITANGRPLPNTEFDTTMSLGDMRFGSSWNYFRNDWFSAAITPSLTFPTGNRADPNNDVTFLLGPEIDRATGAWAINFTNGFDIRPLHWFSLNFEVQTTYQFGYDRDAPDWLPITDCARIEDPERRAQRGCTAGSRPYDRAYDLEQSVMFPDLEQLGDTYHVEPILKTGFMAGFTLELTPIPIQFGYQFSRSEAPTIVAEGPGGTAQAFEQLVDSLGLYEGSELHAIALGTSVPLFPLYLPIILKPKAKWVLGGKNTMKLKAQYGIAAELFLPVADLITGDGPGSEEADD